jgi:NADH dehydrogenase
MHITVVGGGFGGVKTALELAKNKKVRVTLISDKPDFQYYPALYSTATGGSRMQSWIPLGEIFAGYENVTIIIDTVTKLDKSKKLIHTAAGKKLEYSKLVLALGSVTTYFGIEGLDHYAYGIKSQEEITRLKQHLLQDFSTPHGADSHFLIIGAGPTGVELASSLGEYLKHLKRKFGTKQARVSISIIEAAPRVLPRLSEKASAKVLKRLKSLGIHVELNKKVESESADSLTVSGRPIKSHTVIWTSGVANSPFFKANDSQFNLASNGRVIVDKYLRTDKDVYVIGDNAVNPFGGLAQVAVKDGHFVARHILKKSRAKYVAKQLPVVVPVGKHWAIFEYKKLHFGGIAGAAIRQAADFIGYKDILSFPKALRTWLSQEDREEDVIIANFQIEKS